MGIHIIFQVFLFCGWCSPASLPSGHVDLLRGKKGLMRLLGLGHMMYYHWSVLLASIDLFLLQEKMVFLLVEASRTPFLVFFLFIVMNMQLPYQY